VNRYCSSGLQTIAIAANQIMAGQGDILSDNPVRNAIVRAMFCPCNPSGKAVPTMTSSIIFLLNLQSKAHYSTKDLMMSQPKYYKAY
jgi:hypothetical protein